MIAMLRTSARRPMDFMKRTSLETESWPRPCGRDPDGPRGPGGAFLEHHLPNAAFQEIKLGDPQVDEHLFDVAVLEEVPRQRASGEGIDLEAGLVEHPEPARSVGHGRGTAVEPGEHQ